MARVTLGMCIGDTSLNCGQSWGTLQARLQLTMSFVKLRLLSLWKGINHGLYHF